MPRSLFSALPRGVSEHRCAIRSRSCATALIWNFKYLWLDFEGFPDGHRAGEIELPPVRQVSRNPFVERERPAPLLLDNTPITEALGALPRLIAFALLIL